MLDLTSIKQVVEALTRIGGFSNVEENIMRDIVPADNQYHYRNKMTFTVETDDEMLQGDGKKRLKEQPKVGKAVDSDCATFTSLIR